MTANEPRSHDVRLSRDEIARIISVVADSAHLPNRFLATSETDLISLCVTDVIETLEKDAGAVHSSRPDESSAGLLVSASLPWESRILGRRMSSIKHLFPAGDPPERAERAAEMVGRMAGRAAEDGVEFLLARTYTDDHATTHAFERSGFMLVETALDYVYDFTREVAAPQVSAGGDLLIRRAEPSDADAVIAVARSAFMAHVGRFHADPELSADEAATIYQEWLRSSFAGYADAIFLAESGKSIAGFSVWRDPAKSELAAGLRCAHYSIGGVAPEFRGRGAFRALTVAGMNHYRDRAGLIHAPITLRNLGVQCAFQALGWQLRDSRYTFHRWLSRDGRPL